MLRFERLPIYVFFLGVMMSCLLGVLAATRGLSATMEYVFALSLIGTALALASAGCMAARSRGRLRGWMLGGMISALAAFGCWAGALWYMMVQGGTITDWLVMAIPLTGWTGLMMFTGLLFLPRFSSRTARIVRVLAVLLAAALTALIVGSAIILPALEMVGMYEPAAQLGSRLLRIGGVLAIVTCTCMLAVWLMARIPSLAGRPAASHGPVCRFACTCPRCGHDGTFHTGGDVCTACGLVIRVTLT